MKDGFSSDRIQYGVFKVLKLLLRVRIIVALLDKENILVLVDKRQLD